METNFYNPVKLVSLSLLALLIACSWLILPYTIQGNNLMQSAGNESRLIKADTVASYLTREIINTNLIEITGTFATTEYFQYVDRAMTVNNLRPDRNFIFFINETMHTDDLPGALPNVILRINDQEYLPNFSEGPNEVSHHRLSTFSFSKFDPDNNPIQITDNDVIELFISSNYLNSQEPLTFVGRWEGGIELPEELKSRNDITWIAVLALGAGLLSSVLTPCLLQLVIMFGGIMGGLTNSAQSHNPVNYLQSARNKMLLIATSFIIGFLVLYVIAGIVIGYAGNQAQLLFSVHSRNVSIASGLVVIGLSIWMILRGNKISACPVMAPDAIQKFNQKDLFATVIGSIGFALGCTACFGGAIIGTLIVYVGAIGSPVIGGSIMFIFGLGVAIPFFLSALFLSKSKTFMLAISSYRKSLNLISAAVVMLFGLILVTDNFHTVSDFIYPYLGLS